MSETSTPTDAEGLASAPPSLDALPQIAAAIRYRYEEQLADQHLRLRAHFAYGLLVMLCVEAGFSLFALGALGAGWWHLSPWVADVFFGAVFGQIVGLVHVVVRHLFPPD
jgi:hypothetical protein